MSNFDPRFQIGGEPDRIGGTYGFQQNPKYMQILGVLLPLLNSVDKYSVIVSR